MSLPESSPLGPANEAISEGDRASLYRAYRSLTFSEVVGQRHVTQTLRNAVRYGKVAHAYLFTGPRGTGKTSTARILARAVNCLQPRDGEPCNACAICVSMLQRRSLDLIEIDGASNNSVDSVRDLRDRVNLRPAEARRKVFIIDEVHMLSIAAFNALLKTLEEPPEHILFALATTELHKVPATVRSRCQLLELHPIAAAVMADRLRLVCEREGIEAEDDVVGFITSQSTGSLRDALSLLEQIRAFCGDRLVLADVEAALGVARDTHVETLAGAMAAGDLGRALLVAGDLLDGGVDPRQLARQLAGYWRDALLGRARQKPAEEQNVARCRAEQIVQVLYSLLRVETGARRSDSPRWALEAAIAEAALGLRTRPDVPLPASSEPIETASIRLGQSGAGTSTGEAPPSSSGEPGERQPVARQAPGFAAGNATTARAAEIADRPGEIPRAPAPVSGEQSDGAERGDQGGDLPAPPVPGRAEIPDGSRPDLRARWPMILRRLHEANRQQVHALLQKVVVDLMQVEGNVVILPFRRGDSFIRSRLETPANRKILEDTVSEVLGGQWGVRCATIDEPAVRRSDLVDKEYVDEMAAEAKALGGEREPGI